MKVCASYTVSELINECIMKLQIIICAFIALFEQVANQIPQITISTPPPGEGVLGEFMGGGQGVSLGLWNPYPVPDNIQLHFANLF